MKKTFYTELAFIFGVLGLTLGIVFLDKANFGMGMIVAPAYLIYLEVNKYVSWFSLGMSQYLFQLLLIIILFIILKSFKVKFLLSFLTAFFDGIVLDLVMWLFAFIPELNIIMRIICFILGIFCTSIGVSMFFHTYVAPEAYELVVKEISKKINKDIHLVKTIYDISSLLLAVTLSFIFIGFMKFEGIGWGTLVTAVVNGFIIGQITKFLDKHFEFKDAFKFRSFFEHTEK